MLKAIKMINDGFSYHLGSINLANIILCFIFFIFKTKVKFLFDYKTVFLNI